MAIPNTTARARQKSAAGKAAIPMINSPAIINEVREGFTTVPIEHDSDWVRLPKQGGTLCGLGRGYLFQLAKAGKIKSVALRQKDKARGCRLIFKPSILAFIESQFESQNAVSEGGNK